MASTLMFLLAVILSSIHFNAASKVKPDHVYDIAVTTTLPGRPNAMRYLASALASAASTNAFRDARRIFIVVNSHYQSPLMDTALLSNLRGGRTEVLFLPDKYYPLQATGMLYSIEYFLNQAHDDYHGILIVEDDILFSPDFPNQLEKALQICDKQAAGEPSSQSTESSNEPKAPYMLNLYRTYDMVKWKRTEGDYPTLQDQVKAYQRDPGFQHMQPELLSKPPAVTPNRSKGIVGSLAYYFSVTCARGILEYGIDHEVLVTMDKASGKGKIGLGADRMAQLYLKEHDDYLYFYMKDRALVQHIGLSSARVSIRDDYQLPMWQNFARTSQFPYVEDYPCFDDDEMW